MSGPGLDLINGSQRNSRAEGQIDMRRFVKEMKELAKKGYAEKSRKKGSSWKEKEKSISRSTQCITQISLRRHALSLTVQPRSRGLL